MDVWVVHPDFFTVMAVAPTLEAGLQALRQPMSTKLVTLGQALFNVMKVVRNVNRLHTSHVLVIAGSIPAYATDRAVYQMGITLRRIPGVDANAIGRQITGITAQNADIVIAQAVWRAVIASDTQYEPVVSEVYNPIVILTPLLQVDLTEMIPIGRCFYLWSLWDILADVPPVPARDKMFAQLQALVDTYGCINIFTEVPLVITHGLSPVVNKLGQLGGRQAISELIGEYAARPPTRTEVLQRLLVL